MGRYIIKIEDKYLEWSTVVDAPVTWGVDRKDFEKWYLREYGESCRDEFDRRMIRVEEKGTSSFMHDSLDEVLKGNRAGPGETSLSKDEIYQEYCL